MSVLIKGIDIPKEPWDCPCHNGETGQCKVINIGCYDYIPKCCPLVEVPTADFRENKHGKWIPVSDIDRDKNQLFECDNCHHSNLHAYNVEVPFCWFCGADMRGEVGE